MKHESKSKRVLGPLFALLVAALLVPAGAAQDPPKKPVTGPATGSPARESKEVTKLRGRLPAYYGKVVSDKQRTEIYQIQAKYNEQIEKLKEQLDSLTAKRNTEVEQVLTDEQRSEIAKLKESRQSARRASSADSTTTDGQ